MDASFEPFDWSFLPLREIDVLLRCPICKEYLKNAVVVAHCSHNFCSYCIRRDLHFRRQCPVCFKSFNESDLHKNLRLDQLVQSFTRNRQTFLDLLSSSSSSANQGASHGRYNVPLPPTMSQLPDFSEESQTQNVYIIDEPLTSDQPTPDDIGQGGEFFSLPFIPEEETPVDGGCTSSHQDGLGEKASRDDGDSKRCSARKDSLLDTEDDCLIVDHSSAATAAMYSNEESALPQSDIHVADASKGSPSAALSGSLSSGEQKKPSGKVSCPVCGKLVSSTFINSHLDSCLNRTPSLASKPRPPKATPPGSSKPSQKLPNFVYSVMKDKELRTRLKTHGLSSQGSRHELVERLKEFVLRYNAQCDSDNPKSKKEIAAEVEKAERSKAAVNRGGSGSSQSSVARRKSSTDPTEIEVQNKAHARAHADQYAQLIAQARQSRERASKNSSPSHSHSTDPAKETVSSNQATPPLSPVATISLTTNFVKTTPTIKPTSSFAGSTPTQGGSNKRSFATPTPATPHIHDTAPRSARVLATPTSRPKTMSATKMAQIRPDSSFSVPYQSSHATQGVFNGAVARRQRKSEIKYFDDLSPLEEQEVFDPFDLQGRCSEGSTPELEQTAKGREVLAPDSPEDLPETKQCPVEKETTTVPESPSILSRSLRSRSKRKHAVRYAPVVTEQEDSDFDSPKHRKKQRRL